ncbi:MAG: glycosyl hydrolase family 18 protein, partial [Catenulispora sp.]
MRLLIAALVLLLAGCSAPPAPSPRPIPSLAPSARKVAGYFTDWGVYGRDFQVKDLDTGGAADKLTHLMYAFGKVDGGRCAPADAWADYQKPISADRGVDGVADRADAPLRGNFGQLRELKAKHPGLKVIWSFGGWTGSAGFTDAARDPAAFAASCAALVHDPRWAGLFDGIDIDWEYPNACGLRCDASGPSALSALIDALRTAFGPDALVTAAVPGDRSKLRRNDYAAAARHAD